MCGIAGIHYFDMRPCNKEIISKMTRALIHRGPDAEGIYVGQGIALGHRRLSIIDIKSGCQPMANRTGLVHIIFNGEIYNFKELRCSLRKLGFQFTTESDTEVILACYERYGDGFAKYLNGMFAIAIWDYSERKLILSRDRVGKKPLFFHISNNYVVFASEINSLKQFPDIPKEINFQAIDDYFSLGYIPENICIYKDIQKLPPAHMAVIKSGKINIFSYWELPNSNIITKQTKTDYIDELTDLLQSSVQIRMVSDVPIGSFLSGGIDSSTVTSIMALNTIDPINTFSIGGGDGVFNELPYAQAVSKKYNTNHHTLSIPKQELSEILPNIISFFDEPFGDSSMLPTYLVSKLAREKITVALSGEGGDELFAGYDWHQKFSQVKTYQSILPFWIRNTIHHKISPELIEPKIYQNSILKFINKLRHANVLSLKCDADAYRLLTTAFSPHVKKLIFKDGLMSGGQNLEKLIRKQFDQYKEEGHIDRALKNDLLLYLPSDLLVKVDRMSMANSLEVRCPLLDFRLIEFSTRVPSNLKFQNGQSKYILRETAKKFLPEIVYKRRTKRGFSIPISEWIRGKYFNYTKSIILDRTFPFSHLFNYQGIELMLKRHKNYEYDYGPYIWYLLCFVLWSKINIK